MIHRFSMNGFFIVLDINSGAIHMVDNVVYDILEHYNECGECDKNITEILKDKYECSVIDETVSEIQQIIDEGLLFSNNDLHYDLSREKVVKALCLHIAHDCNLKCGYCFANEGEYKGKRSLMSFDTGKTAIDFIIENSGSRKNLEIDFFGGEPLLNFEVIKQIVEYARTREKNSGKKFRFTLTTNGVLLNEDIENYINENMNNVVLSIDGRKEVNDNMRKQRGGQGSYNLIVSKFQRLAESRKQQNYYVRGTFTSENLDFTNDVLHLASLGFKQISVEPVVADSDAFYAITEQHLPQLYAEYEKLVSEMLKYEKDGKEFNFFHFMIDLTGGPCFIKRISGCGAGTEYLAVTPEGDLYPCHQFVGLDEFKMGNINTGITNIEKREMFEKCNIYSKNECNECWAKFYCSGGCAANAYQTHGDIFKPYEIGCKLQRKRTECAIMMKAAIL